MATDTNPPTSLPPSERGPQKDPSAALVSVVRWSAFLCLVFFLVYAGLQVSQSMSGDTRLQIASVQLAAFGAEAWKFAKPLLQLLIVVLVLRAFFTRSWTDTSLSDLLRFDIRSLLALMIVLSFCVGTLAGVDQQSALKDVALVIIGFYFGRRKTDIKNAPEEPPRIA